MDAKLNTESENCNSTKNKNLKFNFHHKNL